MKRNAITRIILYSVLALVLIGILIAGIGSNGLSFSFHVGSGTVVENEGSVEADSVSRIEINWAFGDIVVSTGDVEQITFRETMDADMDQRMTYRCANGTLELNHSKGSINIGFTAVQEKDLFVTVPRDWKCDKLTINGADIELSIQNMTIGEVSIDGADTEMDLSGDFGKLTVNGADTSLKFTGSLTELIMDGADCEAALICQTNPEQITMDGAGCELNLHLPKECGYRVAMDGLGYDFHCDESNDALVYGDQHCEIDVSGLDCDVEISY